MQLFSSGHKHELKNINFDIPNKGEVVSFNWTVGGWKDHHIKNNSGSRKIKKGEIH